MSARASTEGSGSEILRTLLNFSALANILGGTTLLVMVATGATAYPGHRFPPIAIAVGIVLLAQGILSVVYANRAFALERSWRVALYAAQLICLCAGIATLLYAVLYNARAANGGVEPVPVLAGLMITSNAIIALALRS